MKLGVKLICKRYVIYFKFFVLKVGYMDIN